MSVGTGLTTSGQLVHLSWITPQAEDQVQQLSKEDQAKIAVALRRPLRRNRCQLVDNLAQYRVYHFRASKKLRICYRPTEDGLCVIHVSRHWKFDRFARHFTGQSPTNLISLQESIVMKNHQHAGKNGANNAALKPVSGRSAQPNAEDDEQLLLESLREVIGKVVGLRHDALASDCMHRANGLRQEFEQALLACGQKVTQQEARLKGFIHVYRDKVSELGSKTAEMAKHQEDLAAAVARGGLDLDAHCEAQGRILEEVQADVTRRAVQADLACKTLENQVTAFGGVWEERVSELRDDLNRVVQEGENHEAASTAWRLRLEGRLSGTEQALGSLSERLNSLATALQDQQTLIRGLREELSRVSSPATNPTLLAKMKSSCRVILDWARRFCLNLRSLSFGRLWRKRSADQVLSEQDSPSKE